MSFLERVEAAIARIRARVAAAISSEETERLQAALTASNESLAQSEEEKELIVSAVEELANELDPSEDEEADDEDEIED